MNKQPRHLFISLSVMMILSMVLSLTQPLSVSASQPQQASDGLTRERNAQTSKVTLISPSNAERMSATEVLGISALSQTQGGDPVMALAEHFAPEFGLKSAAQNLKQIRVNRSDGGRKSVHYQQTYQGIPILAGELIVNTDDQGDLYSINGEVSPDLNISTTPKLTAGEAQDIALQGVAKWYQKDASSFKASDATLVVFDEKLLKTSTKTPELDWKVEVTPANTSDPIRELVLINAQTGSVSLHFNQIDTTFSSKQISQDPDVTPSPTDSLPSDTATLPATQVPTDTTVADTAIPIDTPIPTQNPTDTEIVNNPTTEPSATLPPTSVIAPTEATNSTFNPTPTPLYPPIEEPEITGLSVTTRYVSPSGDDQGGTNSCTISSSPCLTIQRAINASNTGDIIEVAEGTYEFAGSGNPSPNVVIIGKGINLSGGWDIGFTFQATASTIDGENVNNGILVTTSSAVTIDRFVIQNSTSADSGGIYVTSSSITITNSAIINNHAANRGGGIFLINNASLNLSNSTLGGNSASSSGGGIYNASSGNISIQNSTIAYNSSSVAGGVFIGSGATDIKNSILARNTKTSSGPDCSGSIHSSSYNIIGSTSSCTIPTGTGNHLNVDPKISNSLTGIPPVYELLSGSPAIDTGTMTSCPASDEQGSPRPQGSSCDIGAYEARGAPGINAIITVNSGNNQQKQVLLTYNYPLTVLVRDGLGNPTSGTSVTFNAPSSGASGTFESTGNISETAVTNSSGVATSSIFRANNQIGTFITTASVSGVVLKASFNLQNLSGSGIPYIISVNSGSNQKRIVNKPYLSPFSALVLDSLNVPVIGANVTFIAPATGASGIFSSTHTNTETVVTDTSGIATSSILMANNTAGTYTMSSSVSGVASPAIFTLSNLPDGYYVDPNRPDDNGLCTSPSTACKTINGALQKASAGNTIYLESGVYTGTGTIQVASIFKNISILGGWDNTYSSQSGNSILDGQNSRQVVSVNDSIVLLDHLTIMNGYNSTTNNGGGGISLFLGTLTITNSTIKSNQAANGGGIYVSDSSSGSKLILKNSTITNNSATNSGGGIYLGQESGTINNPLIIIQNTTISDNSALTGGGLFDYSSTDSIQNTIIARNTATHGPDCYGTIASTLNIMIQNLSGCSVVAGSYTVADPVMANFLVGGPAFYPLFQNSPAIDAGDPVTCLSSDERGVDRPQGSACDIGAFEFSKNTGQPASIFISNGNNQSAPPYKPFSTPLSVHVIDIFGNLLAGVTVDFETPSSGTSATFSDTGTNSSSAVTDINGLAISPILIANGQSGGPYSVTAQANGTNQINFALTNIGWYVVPAPIGNDTNDCTTPASACGSIQAAINKAGGDQTVLVANGTYTVNSSSSVVSIYKNIKITGGWESTFTSQTGSSVIDGQNLRRGISLSVSTGNVLVDHFSIVNGYYSSTGGGINIAPGNVTIISSTISQNHSNTTGGAIYLAGNSSLNLVNSTIANNNAGTNGGALYINDSSSVLVNNSTITNNSAISGGGLFNATVGTIRVRNSILAGNFAGNSPDCSGTINSSDHNIIRNTSGCTVAQGIGDHLNIDPKINSYSYGNPGFFALLNGSPAIDAGDPTTCFSPDQRGVARPQGVTCDIGSYEFVSPSGPASSFGIAWGSNQRAATNDSFNEPLIVYVVDDMGNPVGGVNVTFTAPASGAAGVFADTGNNTTTINTNSGGLAVAPLIEANNVFGNYIVQATVAGLQGSVDFQLSNFSWYVQPSGNDSLDCKTSATACATISGALNKATAGDTIRVAIGTYLEHNSTINIKENINLTGGWDPTFSVQTGITTLDGQGVRGILKIPYGNILIDHFLLKNGSVYQGAGIYNTGFLTLRNSTITHNSGTYGAGIYNAGIGLAIFNTTLDHNTALNQGGAIYNSSSPVIINNSTISNNLAKTGGGIYLNSGSASISNLTITQNIATNADVVAEGGGVFVADGVVTNVSNSIIAGNAADDGSDCSGQLGSVGYNLIGYDVGCQFIPAVGDLIGTQTLSINPHLGDLMDNGGPTFTQALLSGSPAIDAGNPVGCTSTDQRGINRPQGSRCDMGAYEGTENTQTSTAIVRTYSALNAIVLPGTFRCDQTMPNCTNGIDPDADSAQRYALGFYNFLYTETGRQSIDGSNMPIISTVHFDNNYNNAYWDGTQMVLGDAHGFAMADDVIGHELTHGVTSRESGLFYYYQSGSIDESNSDIWGELFDQQNGLGNDSPAVRWQMGEDVTGLGTIRNMSNPTLFGDPDRMQSSNYYQGPDDNGGVHQNAGVGDKAAYLMVDGGTFNGVTVTPLGPDKTLAVYYEVQTNLLTSGADYSDLYFALYQGCQNLIGGVKGITASDCDQVQNATNAVQMNLSPSPSYNPEADLCPIGYVKIGNDLFSDDMENGSSNWVFGSYLGNPHWTYEPNTLGLNYAASGQHAIFGNDYDSSKPDDQQRSDSFASMASSIYLPPGSNSYFYFKQAYGFEYDSNGNYDGGVLEYSTDDGATWNDAQSLFGSGQPFNGPINSSIDPPSNQNPLDGRAGFVQESHGYVSSRFDLYPLAGKSVRFRFRVGTDYTGSNLGWAIDDVSIYRCLGIPNIPNLISPASGSLTTNYLPILTWNNNGPNLDHLEVQIATEYSFNTLILDNTSVTGSSITPTSILDPNSTYYWRVRAFNILGQSSDWSTIWSFRTAILPPTLSTPSDGNNTLNLRPTFSWEDIPGADSYIIEISKNLTFNPLITRSNPIDSSYTQPVDLAGSTTYFWHVGALGPNGPSDWSSIHTFTTGNPPSIPILSSPVSGSISTNYTPLLKWLPVTLPTGTIFDHYHIQISQDANFTNPDIDDTSLTDINTPQYTPGSVLQSNTFYYWRVSAVDTLGQFTSWSTIWSIRTAILPPTLLTPTNANDSLTLRPTFSWDAMPGASKYTIQISKNIAFTAFVSNMSLTNTSYTVPTNLAVATTYYWRVQSLGTNGPSLWSPVWTFTSPVPPTAATLVSPTTNSLSASYVPLLVWKAASLPSGTTFDHYRVEVADNSAFNLPVIDDTSITNIATHQFSPSSPLNPNTTYYWRVAAYNTASEFNWSSTWSFRTILPPPNLTLPANTGHILSSRPTFTWDPVPGAKGYTIQISIGSTFSTVLNSGTPAITSFIPTVNLPASRTLYWRVEATGTNGPSHWSTIYNFTTANPPTPNLVSPTTNSLSASYVPLLVWKAASLPSGTTFDHYRVEVADNSAFNLPVIDDTSITNIATHQFSPSSPLNPNTTYYWRVAAYNTASEFNWSSTWSFRTILPPPNLTLPANTGHILSSRPTFTWDPVPGAKGYTIQISIGSTFSTVLNSGTPAITSFIPTVNLPASRTLYWRVEATGTNGPSHWSTIYNFTTANPPATPILESPSSNSLSITNAQLLKWKTATLPVGTNFDHYRVEVADNNIFDSPLVDDASITNINFVQYTLATPLNSNSTYYWRVAAYNILGEYNWSSAWSFRTLLTSPTITLPIDGGHVLSNRPTFIWNIVPGAKGYTIQISVGSAFSTILNSGNPTTTSFIPTVKLPVNTTLFWRIRSTGQNGPSNWSTVASFTTANPPLAPTLVSPNNGAIVSTNPNFIWNQPTLPNWTILEHYQLQISNDINFKAIIEDFDATTSTNFMINFPLPIGKLYWRVRSFNTQGEYSAWSTTRLFTTH